MPKIDTLDALGDEMNSILNTLWTHSKHILSALWAHSEHTLSTLWIHSEYTLSTLWRYAQDLTKSQKTLPTDSLSNTDPRDASASKNVWQRFKKDLTKI